MSGDQIALCAILALCGGLAARAVTLLVLALKDAREHERQKRDE